MRQVVSREPGEDTGGAGRDTGRQGLTRKQRHSLRKLHQGARRMSFPAPDRDIYGWWKKEQFLIEKPAGETPFQRGSS